MTNDTELLNQNNEVRKPKSRLGRWTWVFAAIFGVILVARHFVDYGSAVTETPPVPTINGGNIISSVPKQDKVDDLRKRREVERQLEQETAKFRENIASREAQYRRDVQVIVEKYSAMLPLHEAEECFQRAERGANFVASRDGLCGFLVSAKLSYKIAYDCFNHTHRTEEAINPIVDSWVGAPIEEALKAYEKWADDCRQATLRNRSAW